MRAVSLILSMLTLFTVRSAAGVTPPSILEWPLIVGTTLDENSGGGPLSLREAVITANGRGGGAIYVPAGVYRLTLAGKDEDLGATGDLDIWNGPVTVEGAGADATVIEWSEDADRDRIFQTRWRYSNLAGAARLGSLRLRGVTLRAGQSDLGGAIFAQASTVSLERCRLEANTAERGGAVFSYAGVEASECTFVGNRAVQANSEGGAIAGYGIKLYDCTFVRNIASGAEVQGGALTLVGDGNRVIRCLFYENSAEGARGDGGAIAQDYGSDNLIENCTFTRNQATTAGGAISTRGVLTLSSCTVVHNVARFAPAVWTDYLTPSVGNCILMGNTRPDGSNVPVRSIKSLGHNLVDVPANTVRWSSTDILGVEARLGALAQHGGITESINLQAGSPALDHGARRGISSDQRGATRPFPTRGRSDIGAFEATPQPLLSLPVATLMYRTGDPPLPLDANAQVSADRPTLGGSRIMATLIEGAAASDRLQFLDNPDGLLVRGAELHHGGVLIGRWSGGTPGEPLIASVAGTVGAPAVRALVRGISFSTTADTSGGRTVRLDLVSPENAVHTAGARILTLSSAETSLPAVLTGDDYSVSQSTPLAVAAPGLFANDLNLPVVRMVAAVRPPQHGDLIMGSDGAFVYRPVMGYVGEDQFTYWVTDGRSVSTPAVVKLQIGEIPASTEGAQLSGKCVAKYDWWTLRLEVRASVRNGLVTGSFKVDDRDYIEMESTSLVALVVEGDTARLHGMGRRAGSTVGIPFVLDVEGLARTRRTPQVVRLELPPTITLTRRLPIVGGRLVIRQ